MFMINHLMAINQKKGQLMKKLLTLLLLGIFFTACNSSKTPDKNIIKGPQAPTPVERVDVPFRDFGYSYLPSTIVDSQKALDEFLIKVMATDNWKGKSQFIEKLQNVEINFEAYNLLFYKITEGSGSIKLTPKKPKTRTTTEHHVTIVINRVVPEIVTDDMAYYGLLYKIGKDIADITFDNGQQKVIIENKATSMIVPKNCKAWFDGCNDCATTNDGQVICTELACDVDKYEDFRCTQWQ